MLFMSITAGIQICVKDKKGKYIANRNKGVSWKIDILIYGCSNIFLNIKIN